MYSCVTLCEFINVRRLAAILAGLSIDVGVQGARLASPLLTDNPLLPGTVDWTRPCPPSNIPFQATVAAHAGSSSSDGFALRMRERPAGLSQNSSRRPRSLHNTPPSSTDAPNSHQRRDDDASVAENYDANDDIILPRMSSPKRTTVLGLRLPRLGGLFSGGGPCCGCGPGPTGTAGVVARNIAVAVAIDTYARILFPLVFSALSSIYWAVYLTISSTAATENEFVIIQ